MNAYTALSILDQNPGLSNAQLARRVLVRPQSMIQVTTWLEAEGLIRREPSTDHSRVLRATLTSPGHDLLRKCDAEISALEDLYLSDLTEQQRSSMRDHLLGFVRLLDDQSGLRK
ncbi:MarR family transcriptional regulator [Microbacterium sp. PMB16]|uniref:MarR family transcriptional regulator n=1 Tax=Microbacterium sp. PMB16 TaxID=3120157 RepID=UPI003F4BA670